MPNPRNQIIYDLGCLLHNIHHTALVHAQLMHLAKHQRATLLQLQKARAATFIDDKTLQHSTDPAVQPLYTLALSLEKKLKELDNYWRTTPEYGESGEAFTD